MQEIISIDNVSQLPGTITPAERKVARQLCLGRSNKEIAAALGKTQATVKNQMASLLRKTGESSRVGLALRLVRSLPQETAGSP